MSNTTYKSQEYDKIIYQPAMKADLNSLNILSEETRFNNLSNHSLQAIEALCGRLETDIRVGATYMASNATTSGFQFKHTALISYCNFVSNIKYAVILYNNSNEHPRTLLDKMKTDPSFYNISNMHAEQLMGQWSLNGQNCRDRNQLPHINKIYEALKFVKVLWEAKQNPIFFNREIHGANLRATGIAEALCLNMLAYYEACREFPEYYLEETTENIKKIVSYFADITGNQSVIDFIDSRLRGERTIAGTSV